jgi:SAM-dependent methyltransferase
MAGLDGLTRRAEATQTAQAMDAPDETPEPANAVERRRWNDPRFTSSWVKREELTDVVTPILLEAARLKPGEKVLDVGCGGGGSTLRAARVVGPTGAVVGVDLSRPLLGVANTRAREAKATNIRFAIADAQYDGIAGHPFDIAISQLGVMFFDEPLTAFVNIRRHLRSNGRLVFVCWQAADHNPWHIGTALAGLIPPRPAPTADAPAPGPFSMGQMTSTIGLLERAGFANVRVTPHALTVRASASAVYDDSVLDIMGVPADRLDEARAIASQHLAKFASTRRGLYRFPLALLVVQAVRTA